MSTLEEAKVSILEAITDAKSDFENTLANLQSYKLSDAQKRRVIRICLSNIVSDHSNLITNLDLWTNEKFVGNLKDVMDVPDNEVLDPESYFINDDRDHQKNIKEYYKGLVIGLASLYNSPASKELMSKVGDVGNLSAIEIMLLASENIIDKNSEIYKWAKAKVTAPGFNWRIMWELYPAKKIHPNVEQKLEDLRMDVDKDMMSEREREEAVRNDDLKKEADKYFA